MIYQFGLTMDIGIGSKSDNCRSLSSSLSLSLSLSLSHPHTNPCTHTNTPMNTHTHSCAHTLFFFDRRPYLVLSGKMNTRRRKKPFSTSVKFLAVNKRGITIYLVSNTAPQKKVGVAHFLEERVPSPSLQHSV